MFQEYLYSFPQLNQNPIKLLLIAFGLSHLILFIYSITLFLYNFDILKSLGQLSCRMSHILDFSVSLCYLTFPLSPEFLMN